MGLEIESTIFSLGFSLFFGFGIKVGSVCFLLFFWVGFSWLFGVVGMFIISIC